MDSREMKLGSRECLLSEADMSKLKEWNNVVPEQADQCVHALIAERCRAQEDAIAVCAWDGDLTYGNLDILSSALAVHLIEHGVGAEMFVPLCFEKSRWTAVAMLGVLKAGAAFVLLDPSQPVLRLQELCVGVNAALVLSSSANRSLCEKLAGDVVVPSKIVEVPSLSGPPKPTPAAVVWPYNAAYASFTSGSTGRSKAVVVEHSAFCSNALAHNARLSLHEESRVLQSASYAFGASILQMVMTWIAGGCVCVPSESECRDNLAAAVSNYNVNWAFFTPSHLRTVRPQNLSGLQHVFLGGEPPARSDILAWADNIQVSGAYGSAECSILCAIAQNMRSLSEPQSIGQMTGCVGWVVEPDDHERLVSLGMVGELLVEGPNLARGYLGDEKRTTEAFIEAPSWFSEYCRRFSKTSRRVGRMYKTGDLVRYNPDGSLTFVGRKDTQINLHGQRVELGEVEHHIRESLVGNNTLPIVAEVVTPCDGDHPALVAFIAVGEMANRSPGQAALKQWVQGLGDWLLERVPRYMVPSAYVAIDMIPLTATGKTDRRRLREIGGALKLEQLADLLLASDSTLCKPATEIERQLTRLWAHVLNLPPNKISAADNFLRIGGDSITAVQLVGAARDEGLSLTVTQIFDAPRLCDMASVVGADDYTKEAILPFSLLRNGTDVDLVRAQTAFQCGVDSDLVEDVFPCTSLQEGMLAITAKRPGNYIHRAVLDMSSDVDTARLEQAWRQVVETIPILRTRITDLTGQGLVQVVLGKVDIFTVGPDLEAYLQADQQEPMGLGTPLARIGIISNPQSVPPVVVFTIHHALFDGWSMSLVLKQVEQVYLGRNRNLLVPFQGFVQYILENTKDTNEYWQSQLRQLEAVPFPPLPYPGYQPKADDLLKHRVSGLQWPQNGFTQSTAIRLAWAILLGQYTNTTDVIFGATVTGRQMPVPGVERMAGPTIATVPVRVKLEWEADIQALLQTIQTQSISMTPHEQMGLQQIRRISSDTERACQFQSLLVVQPREQENGGYAQDTCFKLGTKTGSENGDPRWRNAFNTYALMIECYLEEDGTMIWISFDSQVMEKVAVQRIAQQLEHVLRELCGHRYGPVRARDLCGPSKEDYQELEKWNQKVPGWVERCVHELIAERCRGQPDAPAVCAWDGDFTYSELDRLSSVLAAHLIELRVEPEMFVPLLFEKSRWTTVAMLGVMKAGGAFVLLDPSHPRERLQVICQAVSAAVIVASASQVAMADQLVRQVVTVGNDSTALSENNISSVTSIVEPHHTAYAVFTSGSTGGPKGVTMQHSAFCTSGTCHGSTLRLNKSSRVLQFSSYAFDMSLFDTLTTLLMGGCVCVPSDDQRRHDISRAISELQVNYAMLTPAVLALIEQRRVPTLKGVAVGGEQIPPALVENWASIVKLALVYGPTECSVLSTTQVKKEQVLDSSNIGYGTGCVCWVADPIDHERLLPIGAAGELLIEGPIVGRGYLNDPEKTAAAFINPPAWLREFRAAHPGNPGGDRVYKTGDLVQYAADGSLRFIGRKDTQVKLRGQRIELGEVEYHTRECFAGARDVVAEVVTPAEEGRAPMLVVFVWMEGMDRADHDTTEEMLFPPTDAFRAAISAAKARLYDAVPPYMVPAVFLPLAEVPLTATGKTDRRRVRASAAALSRTEIEAYSVKSGAKRPPATAAERTLQRLWARVLNLASDAMGADDSFFRLGGDSITAMQLSSLARTEGFTLSVSDIFHAKTIAALAPFVGMDSQMPVDVQDFADVPFDLSPIQRLFFQLAPSGANHFNQSFLIPLATLVTTQDLVRAIAAIVDRHSMLRARFSQRSDGTWSQIICTDVEASYRYRYSVVPLLQDARDVLYTSQRSLDFRNGPLLSVDLIDTNSGQEQYIFLVAHHFVIDLVSWRIILGDLEDFLQSGHISGPQTVPFQAWCQLQADYARDHLNPTRALPFTPPHAAADYWGLVDHLNTWDNTIHSSFVVSEEVTMTLFGKANDALQTQPVEIFQAALWHAFVRTFRDRHSPAIYNEGHGRESWAPTIDLSRTVGWFTTIWPLCITTDGDNDSIVDVVRRSKDARRRTPSNGWAYFASRFLHPEGQRAFETDGLVEVAFNYLGLYQQFERKGALLGPPLALEDWAPNVAGDIPRFALIDVSASVEQGCLHFSFSYNRHMQHQDRIRQWITHCKRSLQEAAERLAHLDRRFTLCDFPLLPLTYDSLDVFMEKIASQVSPLEVEDAYPCSPMQRGILFSRAKNSRLYQTWAIWKVVPNRVSQPVDLGRLRRAWQQVVDRHAILRTFFVECAFQQAYVNQVVRTSAIADIETIKVKTDNDPVATIKKHLWTAGRDERFLHRMVLYATSMETFCAFDIHHALIDAHSMRLLQRDLRLAYDGDLLAGRAPLYSNYISYLQGLPSSDAEDYWKSYMDGVQPCIFPALCDKTSGEGETTVLTTSISIGSRPELHELCQRYEVTLPNLFRVAWGIVLQLYTGSDTVCFGYLNSGRDVPVLGVEDSVGPFINILVCRMRISSESECPVLSLAQASQNQYLESLPYQHYSLADVFHLAGMSGMPLFNTLISVQRLGGGPQEDTSLGFETVGAYDPTEYDISVTVDIAEEHVEVYIHHKTTVLGNRQAEMVAHVFEHVVSEIARRPYDSAKQLNVISESDKQLLKRWNGIVPARVERCVHELIAERFRAQPDAPAVCAWDGNFTYGKLDQLSSALAAYLIELGVEPEMFVPLLFDKSRWTTVAMLGVMKAGGAFVLLDPLHPRARLETICRAVSASVLVVSASQTATADLLGAQVVTVGSEGGAWRSSNGNLHNSQVAADNALYAVFTSGSTGSPKGAVITHSAFATSASTHGHRLALTRESRVFQFASYGFDVSVSDSLTTLVFGGCICVPSKQECSADLANSIRRYGATWAHLTPSVVRSLQPCDVLGLKVLALIGEPMSSTDVHTWATQVHLVNSYGPAECAVVSATHRFIHAYSEAVVIGLGVGCVCWLVDAGNHERLVPIGAVGELLIEGPIVGRGYLNDPERTAAAFIEPPAWLREFRAVRPGNLGGDRLYKTGDLVQYAADGSLRFVGRKDTQVKLRGQRIELGEIEHHTRECFPGSRDVVAEVVTPIEEGRAPMLVAFVWVDGMDTPDHDTTNEVLLPPTDGFRAAISMAEARLHDTVPAYMVPAVFIPVTGIPLTATGKTDRRWLRERAAALSRAEIGSYSVPADAKRPPVTATQRTLQQLWARVLNLPLNAIGADDSFFRLGGDSITAMQLAGAARQDGLTLSVADVFQHPTLSNLSTQLQSTPDRLQADFVPFSLVDEVVREEVIRLAASQCQVPEDLVADLYPCTALQEGLLALTMKKDMTYVARFSYELPGDVDLLGLRAAWNAVADANPILRTRIIQSDALGTFQAVVLADLEWAIYDNMEALEPVSTPFGLGDSLVRAIVIQADDHRSSHRFSLLIHHAVYDAWSLPLLLEQTGAALRGESLRHRPLSPFVAYLMQSQDAAEDFWRSELAEANAITFPPLRSPFYMPTPVDSLVHTISLPPDVVRDFTMSTTLRLAWALTVSQYSQTNDVVFGLTVTGRGAPVPGIEQMTGPTIATIPLRVRLDPALTVRQALQQVQEQAARTLPYEQTGLQNIRRLSDEAAAACNFQNLLVIQPSRATDSVGLFTKAGVTSNEGAFTTYALTLLCELSSDSVAVQATYDPCVIDGADVRRLLYQLAHVTQEIRRRPSRRVRDVGLLNPKDLGQLQQWNAVVPARVERCVHELIAERCRGQPDAPAVCAWDGDFTYGELDRLSSGLAAHLAELGVGPEVFVPLLFEKSRWTAVAMLGVMKAGGAFVLLDPSHPRARLAGICQAVSATVVVASVEQASMADEWVARVVTVRDTAETLWTGDAWKSSVNPNTALYAVFTSGSTGAPKGAVITHSAFGTGASFHAPALGLTNHSRVFQFSSYAFDNSITDILTTLSVAGCVCVPSEFERKNGISRALQRYQATMCFLTPSFARVLEPVSLPSLSMLVLMGEPPATSDINRWAGSTGLWNEYGPAECSVIATVQRMDMKRVDSQNVGCGMGCVTWVVDTQDYGRLLPIGAVGELLIEGPIVGRGYLNDPERTAAAFINPPAWLREFRAAHPGNPGGDRVYKTGDLVQYAADGSLRFVGRKDTQVKLRGQRIELGEVEHHTRECFDGARDVVAEVVTAKDGGRPPMLVAFVRVDTAELEGAENAQIDDRTNDILLPATDTFRVAIPIAESRLHDAVPAYMVPAVFLPLAAVPLTATGKTDRRRLRDCAAALSRVEIEAYSVAACAKRAPATAAELTLQRLWARVLHLPPEAIGADDSFFRLGGDSISAMQLAAAAREDGFTLGVADVFQHPQLSSLSTCLQSITDDAPNFVVPFALIDQAGIREEILRLAVAQCRVDENQIADIYPCTALQEGLMALTMKTAGAYVAHFSYTLPGDTDVHHLCDAWNEVAFANPILHTRIVQSDTLGTFQVVVPTNLEWAVYDSDDALLAQTSSTCSLGEPLVGATVVRAHDPGASHRVILSMHHAVYDAWSLPLLLEQAEAALGGKPLLPRPFSPFVAYVMQSRDTAESFWRSELAALDAVPFPPLPAPSYTPAPTEALTHTIPLGAAVTGDFTLATRLRLAWALTLSQYTQTDDIVFGLTVTGRGAPVPGIEQMTGPTIATIPLRVRLGRDDTVSQALEWVQDHAAWVLPNEQTGLQVIRRLSEEAAAACDFQNLLVIQPRRKAGTAALFREAGVMSNQGAFTTYALTLLCELGSDSVTVQAAYDPHVIGEAEVQRLLYQLAHVMQEIQRHPNRRLKDLNSLSPEDCTQLQQWNGVVPARVERCVHELIAEQCAAQPDAPAVCAWDGDFTYGELDRLSSALAAHLAGLGVRPEVFVPLLFEKSRWTTVAMLGVMKAGGAFVLLDPSQPQMRLQAICNAVFATFILSSAGNATAAAGLSCQSVIVGDKAAWYGSSGCQILSHVTSHNVLYAVFTSGSMGIPKGISIEHRSFATRAVLYPFPSCSARHCRVFQFSSYTWDVSIFDTLFTLVQGGCVCVPSENERRDDLGIAMTKYAANSAILTPSMLTVLDPASIPTLKFVTSIGEILPGTTAEKWISRLKLNNSYGPTECTVLSHVSERLEQRSDMCNVGSATGCVCWVVDSQDHERLLPIGAVGEMLIEGPIVGRGYLNEPEKTAAAFIDPPAWLRDFRATYPGNPGGDRVYKTGDLVQYAADGSLRFMGRKDTQVKLRGQRIELGEVEHHTRECFPGARDVVAEVVTPTDGGRAPMLVAFMWVASDEEGATDNILIPPTDAFRAAIPAAEARLHDAVPAYMVPAVFLPLAAVPLTATGKTDRRRLHDRAAALSRAEIEAYSVAAGTTKRAPATAAERTLQRLWAHVLNLPLKAIGADDSFFRLSGNSITAMQLSSLARTEGIRLSVSDVFQHPVLSAQATLLSNIPDALASEPAPFSLLGSTDHVSLLREVIDPYVSTVEHEFSDAFPTTEFQADFVCTHQCTYFLLDLHGTVDPGRLLASCQAVIQKYAILRSSFFPRGRGIIQAILTHMPLGLARLTSDDDPLDLARTLCRQDSATPLPFGTAPFRVFLVSNEDRHHVLILRLSHAQYDGVSLPYLYRDLSAAYQGEPLPPAPTFALYMQYRLSRKAPDVYQFWRSFLDGATMTHLDYNAIGGADDLRVVDSAVETSKTIPLPSPPAGTTMATLVKTAWSVVLARLTNQTDIVFGHMVNARSVPILWSEAILGPCVNIIPVRVTLRPGWTARDLLGHVQLQHARTLPFETSDLRDILEHSTTWPSTTRFGTIVYHQNIHLDPPLSLGDVECRMTAVAFPPVTKDFYIVSVPAEDSLEVSISASRRMVDPAFAANILGEVCETIDAFSRCPDLLISLHCQN